MWSSCENRTASMGRLDDKISMYSQLLSVLQRQILLPCFPLTLQYITLPLLLNPTSLQWEIKIYLTTFSQLYNTWYTLTAFLNATPIMLITGWMPTLSMTSPYSALKTIRYGIMVVLLIRRLFCESLILEAQWLSILTEIQQWKEMGLQILMLLYEAITIKL